MSTLLSNISVWVYRILLLAYPPTFRWEYGQEMMQLFRDMLQDAIRQRGCWGILEVWFWVLPDWVVTVRQQRLLVGNYYRHRWIFSRMVQAAIALIFVAFGFVYWLYVR